MAIMQKSGSHSWRAAITLPVTAALALAAAFVAFGPVSDAAAHGSCVNNKTSPSKPANRIKGTNQYNCSFNHDRTKGCAQIFREQSDGTLVGAGPPNCRQSGSSNSSPTVTATAACQVSAYYRTQGVGKATNANDVIAHAAVDNSLRQWINCSTSDVTSTGGVFEDFNAYVGGITIN